jgi:type IV secretory pathway VirD2 relaxase
MEYLILANVALLFLCVYVTNTAQRNRRAIQEMKESQEQLSKDMFSTNFAISEFERALKILMDGLSERHKVSDDTMLKILNGYTDLLKDYTKLKKYLYEYIESMDKVIKQLGISSAAPPIKTHNSGSNKLN